MSLSHQLVEHFFRHENGRLVAILTRVLGTRHLDLVEDVVQAALVQALQSWSLRGVPDDPSAWLFRVARNLALDALRRDKTWKDKIQPALSAEEPIREQHFDQVFFTEEIQDAQLRMLFAFCHPAIPIESQIAFALKTLCGFSTQEIARALLTTPGNIQKRIVRAKERLREENLEPESISDLPSRLEAVQRVVYLLFNEGYSSSHEDHFIRENLCEEAIRLGTMLVNHPLGDCPTTKALLSLMYFHSARFAAREDDSGRLLLLEEQDRSKWDVACIRAGFDWLARSAQGEELSQYHLEAGIAAEHVLVANFPATNWPRILWQYDLLVQVAPSAIHQLNRTIAIAHVHGPEEALQAIAQIPVEIVPANYHLWEAVLGELHRRAGNYEQAKEHLEQALAMSPTKQERELLQRRLHSLKP